MRTFIALEIPVQPSLKESLVSVKSDLRNEHIKWVNFSTLHLTLFFFGEVSPAQVDDIKGLMAQNLSAIPKFSLSLKGLGAFGPAKSPKVLWIGTNKTPELLEAYNKVNKLTKSAGFESDPRGFNPHITIGRINKIVDIELLQEIVLENSDKLLQQTLIDRIILYKSDLTPKGAIYTPQFTQILH